ncbi:MAG TPA: pallilysin-related adhesin [Rectinemataceae bacterium]
MRKVLRVMLILGFSIAFVFIMALTARMRRERLEASLPVSERSYDFTSSQDLSHGEADAEKTGTSARISAEADETFLQAFDINLDEDEEMEQVIVSRPRSTESGTRRLSVIVAEYQAVTGAYYRLWKGETEAVKPKAFVFQPRDILGSPDMELLCFGIDESGNQTLSVFARRDSGKRLFETIFQGSGLKLELLGPDREGGARESGGQYSIAVYSPGPEGSGALDRNLTLYTYSESKRRYIAGPSLPVLGEKVEKDYIDSIATGSVQDFLGFLEGLWVKESETWEAEPVLLSFGASSREIAIQVKKNIQIWTWDEASPSLAGIRLAVENSAVPDLARLLTIDLVGVDKIEIGSFQRQTARFSPQEPWNGRYVRIAGTARTAFVALRAGAPQTSALPAFSPAGEASGSHLEGRFSSYAVSIELRGGKFAFGEADGTLRGFYELSELDGELILDLIVEDEPADPKGRRSFLVMGPAPGPDGVETITLREIRMKARSYEPLYKPDIIMRKEAD